MASSSTSSSPEMSAATTSAEAHDRLSYKYSSRDEVLEDLSSRFILNLPDEELASLERVCFQVEQAHWFYEDFVREENPQFPSLPLKKFSEELFNACPMLHQWRDHHEHAFNKFMQYKTRVPVCGAIMLNSKWDKCVLVKGWKSSSGWGFPKGKINESESKPNCAIREVLEETGYNLAGQVNPEYVIEMFIREQSISLYIVPDVPEDYPFETKTRKEISRIEWFKLTDLPTWKRNKTCPGRFYLISPFISRLKEFINANRPRQSPRKGAKPKKTSATNGSQTDTTQESSSQSSDPHTPSPRSSELVPHVAEPDTATPHLDTPILDPHFANLLTKLNGSIADATKPKEQRPLLSQISVGIPVPSSEEPSTPIPTTGSSVGSHKFPVRTNAFDTPSATHTAVSTPLTSEQIPGAATGAGGLDTVHPMLRPLMSPALNQAERRSSPFSGAFDRGNAQSLSQQLEAHRISSPAPSNPRPQRSHRTKSTADISPYLCKAEPISVTRQMRQLTLLESVAKESERLAPTYDFKPLAPDHPSFGHRGLTSHPSLPYLHEPHDLRVIYSSSIAPPNVSAFQPPQRPFSVMDDPFQVRDRRLGDFHQPPLSPSFHPARMGPYQHPLMNTGSTIPSLPSWAPAPYQRHFPPVAPPQAMLPCPTAPLPHPSMQSLPPHLSQPPFIGGPPMNHFGAGLPPPPARMPDNAHLLSILNNAGYQPTNP